MPPSAAVVAGVHGGQAPVARIGRLAFASGPSSAIVELLVGLLEVGLLGVEVQTPRRSGTPRGPPARFPRRSARLPSRRRPPWSRVPRPSPWTCLLRVGAVARAARGFVLAAALLQRALDLAAGVALRHGGALVVAASCRAPRPAPPSPSAFSLKYIFRGTSAMPFSFACSLQQRGSAFLCSSSLRLRSGSGLAMLPLRDRAGCARCAATPRRRGRARSSR